ncbi:unnamed protein product, partial [Mesorhabditis belari]|uniref:Ion transport domain-containing protein n=1 Tax=Mesorhabditis belari TaxID=2138241 RepID=A0AAF3ECJ3_9BILA
MNSGSPSFDLEANDNPVARRDTIRLTDYEREYKRRRFAVYNFLDHPRSASNFPYHFSIFVFVLISVIVGALADASPDDKTFYNVNFIMEVVLAIFFILEFAIRIWSIGADAKYKGFRGFLRYACRLVCMIDMLIILVTFGMLFIDREKNRGVLLDVLRFVQILRLFHIDRQMTTWNMIRKMTLRSLFELTAAYYICSLLFMAMSLSVYEMESLFDRNHNAKVKNETEAIDSTFNNYGDAMWFTIVSFLTIGYGDIVPKHWPSKVITCVLAYAIYCTFIAASTLVSVGMTLMMESETKDKQYSKMRLAAAEVIQHWFRYHLATNRKQTWNTIPYFKHVCFKLYLADEKIKKTREYTKKIKEKYGKTTEKKPENKDKKLLRYTSLITQLTMDDYYNDPNAKPTPVKRDSLLSKSAQSMDEPDRRGFKKEAKRASRLEKTSPSSSISSSFDGNDFDKEVDIQMLYENTSFDSKRTSYDINAIDEEVLRKYRPLIRFFNYLLFLRCMRKFKRLRKPYQLLDAETELCEMEHNRNQLFHDLEIKLEATIGKPSPSPFHHNEGKLSIEKRLEAVEQHTEDMDGKVQEIIRLAEAIAEIVGLQERKISEVVQNAKPDRRKKTLRRQNTLAEIEWHQ